MIKVINVMDISLDGKIAVSPLQDDAGRLSYGFGCKSDQDFVRTQISQADAIITGANSIRATKGVWQVKGKNNRYPLWCVFTTEGLDDDLKIWKQFQVPKLLVTPRELKNKVSRVNVDYIAYGHEAPASFILSHLESKGVEVVLLFGGGYINRLFYSEDLVDELKITISPIIVGNKDAPNFVNSDLPNPVRLVLLSSHQTENHIFLNYRIIKNR